MSDKNNTTKVVTGIVRLSYANIWEPASVNGGTPKYSVTDRVRLRAMASRLFSIHSASARLS